MNENADEGADNAKSVFYTQASEAEKRLSAMASDRLTRLLHAGILDFPSRFAAYRILRKRKDWDGRTYRTADVFIEPGKCDQSDQSDVV